MRENRSGVSFSKMQVSPQPESVIVFPDELWDQYSLSYEWSFACSSINDSFFATYANIHVLTFDICSDLTRIPDALGQLTLLERLMINSCPKLAALPDSIGELINLKSLTITCAYYNPNNALKQLPSTLGNLCNLKELWVKGQHALTELPDSLVRLDRLSSLRLDRCTSLLFIDYRLVFMKSIYVLVPPTTLTPDHAAMVPHGDGGLYGKDEIVPFITGVHVYKFNIFVLVIGRQKRRTLPPELWHWIYNEFLLPF